MSLLSFLGYTKTPAGNPYKIGRAWGSSGTWKWFGGTHSGTAATREEALIEATYWADQHTRPGPPAGRPSNRSDGVFRPGRPAPTTAYGRTARADRAVRPDGSDRPNRAIQPGRSAEAVQPDRAAARAIPAGRTDQPPPSGTARRPVTSSMSALRRKPKPVAEPHRVRGRPGR